MKKIAFLFILLIVCNIGFSQSYVSGYSTYIKGQTFEYHAPQPDAGECMLLRSEQEENYIEWETDALPANYKEKTVTFLMLAGIDVNATEPHSWFFYINDEFVFHIQSPTDTIQKNISHIKNPQTRLEFDATNIDRHGDFMGYLKITLPTKLLKKNKIAKIRVKGESAGSKTWFMVFKYKTQTKVKLLAEPAIKKGKTGNVQLLRAEVVRYGGNNKATVAIGDTVINKTLNFGYSVLYLEIPQIRQKNDIPVKVSIGNEIISNQLFTIYPVENQTIYLLHHSHVDIGYTHIQSEVEQLQWSYIESAIELAEKSQTYPQAAHFKWNVEVMWAVDSYLKNASAEKRARFVRAVQNGWIELDALYANELTALCTQRELIELTESSRRIATECGVKNSVAMISDIPGWTWGLVNVLAESGVKYLSCGTNQGHRIGSILQKWGDKPFYWVSASGSDSVLTWIHQKGYSYFHTGLGYTKLDRVLSEAKIFDYINQMAINKYPYDVYLLRYNIGSDNGPTDATLSEAVSEWNKNYVSPQLVIATASEAFEAFEAKYGKTLPSFAGDITAYWEDGAISTALETSINRSNAASLEKSEAMFALHNRSAYDAELAKQAWQQILLYDEHTWGSWNSISEPLVDFTKQQWAVKQQFALSAQKMAHLFQKMAVSNHQTDNQPLEAIEVINTNSWKRTDLVEFKANMLPSPFVLKDNEGKLVQYDIVDNTLCFVATDIPAFGSKLFTIEAGAYNTNFTQSDTYTISEGNFNISVDTQSGALERLTHSEFELANWVDTTTLSGLNSYFYVEGRNPKNQFGILQTDKIKVLKGNILTKISIESAAKGCESLTREITLIKGINRFDIKNTLDKSLIYNQEGVHIAFPFNIEKGVLRYDLAFAAPRAEEDQLEGSNKNYYTVENWVDISNENYGMTWATTDAPLIEIGEITTDPIAYNWIQKLNPTQTFYSYLMNNYWETNYCAAQEGKTVFSYSIQLHKKFNHTEAEKFGIENRQKLIAIQTSKDTKALQSPILLNDNGLIVTQLKPVNGNSAVQITLYNTAENAKAVEWSIAPKAVYLSNLSGEKREIFDTKMLVPVHGLLNLYIEF